MHARMLGALLGGLALVLPVVSVPAVASPLQREPGPLIARHGTFTEHGVGYPYAGTAPAQQIATATVTQDVARSRIRASITLRAVPSAETDSEVAVGFGQYVDGTCKLRDYEAANALAPADGASRTGAVITIDRPHAQAGSAPWDCAGALTLTRGYQTLDLVSGPLIPEFGPPPTPDLTVASIQLLRKDVSRLRLVRGAWTTLDVTVANRADSPAHAEGLRVTGKGRGLLVKPSATLPYALAPGADASVTVRVKLTGKKQPKKLRLLARSGDASSRRSVPVTRVKPAARPVAGKYRAKNEVARFRIKGRKVVGFRTGELRTRCGAAEPYTYTAAAYDFRRAKIGRNGLVHATRQTDAGVRILQLRVVGRKVTRGHFSHTGADGCVASVTFQARRR